MIFIWNFWELLWVVSIISRVQGSLVSVKTLHMAAMIPTCLVALWLGTPLSETNLWTSGVMNYSI